jgi:hypothetical protein
LKAVVKTALVKYVIPTLSRINNISYEAEFAEVGREPTRRS